MPTPDIIPISAVVVENRQRIDYGDITELAQSIQELGTIEPIVLTPDGDSWRLVAGGRRFAAITSLGYTQLYHGATYKKDHPGFVCGEELSADVLAELELEENIRRKDMSWQEEILATARLHRMKVIRFGEQGKSWGYRQTGRMLKCSVGQVQYTLSIAQLLQDKTHPIWELPGITAAIGWMLEQKERELEKHLVQQHREQSQIFSPLPSVEVPDDFEDLFTNTSVEVAALRFDPKEEARQRYLSNPHNPPDQFELYWTSRQRARAINLSSRLLYGSCLDLMDSLAGKFDHIITDPPYAIDMANLDQANSGILNIDTIAHTHEVEPNKELLLRFLAKAYATLPVGGFLVFWADYSMWETLCNWGNSVGFRVQKWPIVWVKTYNPINQSANQNFTKTTELAIVMSKSPAVLAITGPAGHVLAGQDTYKATMKHPFVKPLAAWQHLIEAVSLKGQTLLDPFSGEGSGVLSFLTCERNFFSIELDEIHYNRQLLHIKDFYLARDPSATFV